jgi:hypothetical protein
MLGNAAASNLARVAPGDCSDSSDSAASGRAKRCATTAPLPRSRSPPLRSWSLSAAGVRAAAPETPGYAPRAGAWPTGERIEFGDRPVYSRAVGLLTSCPSWADARARAAWADVAYAPDLHHQALPARRGTLHSMGGRGLEEAAHRQFCVRRLVARRNSEVGVLAGSAEVRVVGPAAEGVGALPPGWRQGVSRSRDRRLTRWWRTRRCGS